MNNIIEPTKIPRESLPNLLPEHKDAIQTSQFTLVRTIEGKSSVRDAKFIIIFQKMKYYLSEKGDIIGNMPLKEDEEKDYNGTPIKFFE
ncbi:MAG: hypothetical protein QM529_06480 [Hydrotalea sp.]|nr:hypothetical protein [Hydrotalea sp.]